MDATAGIAGIANPGPTIGGLVGIACIATGGPGGLACHGVLGGGSGGCVPLPGKGGCIIGIDGIPQFIIGAAAGI